MVMSAVLIANGDDKPVHSDDEVEDERKHGCERRDP